MCLYISRIYQLLSFECIKLSCPSVNEDHKLYKETNDVFINMFMMLLLYLCLKLVMKGELQVGCMEGQAE